MGSLQGTVASASASRTTAEPQRCFDYARSAKAMTLAGHTWDRQIDQILQAGEAVRR